MRFFAIFLYPPLLFSACLLYVYYFGVRSALYFISDICFFCYPGFLSLSVANVSRLYIVWGFDLAMGFVLAMWVFMLC